MVVQCRGCIREYIKRALPLDGISKQNIARQARSVFLLFLVLALVWGPSSSYAIPKSEGVQWQLIFLSPYGGCTNYQYQMANVYDEVTAKYFGLYKFPNSRYGEPICMSSSKYSSYKVPGDLGLLILVYDYELGRKELNQNQLGGFYEHVGTDRTKNHVIVFCDCGNFKFSDPVWILSHELSHFILYYDGFDRSISEELIHSWGKRYDYCNEAAYDPSCTLVTTKIHGTNYFTTVRVMKPYGPAIGTSPIPQGNETLSPQVAAMQKEVTKWWLAGKISDQEYAKVLGYAVGKPVQNATLYSGLDGTTVVFADGPVLSDEKTIDDVSKWSKDQVSVVFSRVPFKTGTGTVVVGAISPTFTTVQISSVIKLDTEIVNLPDSDFVISASGAKMTFNNGLTKVISDLHDNSIATAESDLQTVLRLVNGPAPLIVDTSAQQEIASKANGIISRLQAANPDSGQSHIPDWFKSRAKWWSVGQLWNDTEFVSSAKYLLAGKQSGEK